MMMHFKESGSLEYTTRIVELLDRLFKATAARGESIALRKACERMAVAGEWVVDVSAAGASFFPARYVPSDVELEREAARVWVRLCAAAKLGSGPILACYGMTWRGERWADVGALIGRGVRDEDDTRRDEALTRLAVGDAWSDPFSGALSPEWIRLR